MNYKDIEAISSFDIIKDIRLINQIDIIDICSLFMSWDEIVSGFNKAIEETVLIKGYITQNLTMGLKNE